MSEIFQSDADFKQHDREILSLNVRSVDLSWSTKYHGGEEIENEDVLFILGFFV